MANHRQNFLLTFFKEDNYAEKEVNGFWLVKQWNGSTKEWQVAIFTPESFKKRLDYLKTHSQMSDKENELPF